MSENILKLIEKIRERNNPDLKKNLDYLKEKLQPIVLKDPEPENMEKPKEGQKIENKERISFHVTYFREGKCWKISLAGEDKAISLKRTKQIAIDKARELAKRFTKSQIIIHKKNGQFQEERTYGSDPRSSKG